MSNTFDKKIVNGEVALTLLQGLKSKISSEDVQASRIKGVLDVSNIPQTALPSLIVVQSDKERFELTPDRVKKGDTVRVIQTNKLYLVADTDRLSSQEGYIEYAQTVDWGNIEGKPETFTPSSHTQDTSTINSLNGYVKGEDTAPLSTGDTLNVALSKIESTLGIKLNRVDSNLNGEEKDIVKSLNKNAGQFIQKISNVNQMTKSGWYLCGSECEGTPEPTEGIIVNYLNEDKSSVKIWYSATKESIFIKQEFSGISKISWTKIITKKDVDDAREAIEQAINSKQGKRDEELITDDKTIVGAINELHNKKQSSTDQSLATQSKTIVGAISELKNDKAEKIHDHNNLYNTKEEIIQALAKKEDTIAKNTAFNKNFGIVAGTVLEGDKYEELSTSFEASIGRLEGVVVKKFDKSGGVINGNVTIDGNLITKNNSGLQCNTQEGMAKTIIYLDSTDTLKVGDSKTNIVLDSDNISVKGGHSLWTTKNFTPSEKQNVNEPSLKTSEKTISGGINEVFDKAEKINSDLSTKAPLVHNHDDRYTTTSVMDVRFSAIEEDMIGKEPIIAEKKTAFNKDFGETVGTVLEGKHLPTINSKIEEKQNKRDISLTTSDKTIVGAINEIKSNTLGSTGGKVNGAINSVEHNGAGNYNIVESDGRTVHGTLYGRVTSSDGVGEVGLYNQKSSTGIRLKDNGNVLIDSKSLKTTSKEITGAINELSDKKFDKTGGTLTGSGEILKIKNNDTRGSAYISFFNDGIKKGWIGRGSSGIDSIAMHNQYSGKGLTLKHDGGTHIDAMNLNTTSKEIVGAINELNSKKLNIDGSNKMTGTFEFSHGTDRSPNIKFLSSDRTPHGALNARSGDVDKDIYLENNVSGNGIYFKDNGEVRMSAKKSMWIGAPNLATKSKEIIGAINELSKKEVDTSTLVKKAGDTMTGDLIVPSLTANKYIYIQDYYSAGGSARIWYNTSSDNYPKKTLWCDFVSDIYLDYSRDKKVWHGGNFNPDSKLNTSGGTVRGALIQDTDSPYLEFRKNGVSQGYIGYGSSGVNMQIVDRLSGKALNFTKNGVLSYAGDVQCKGQVMGLLDSWAGVIHERGDYQAIMGCSNTSGEYLFGGKPKSEGTWNTHIRVSPTKLQYTKSAGNIYDIFHTGNFDPNTKLNTSGGTLSGNLTVNGNVDCKSDLVVKRYLHLKDYYGQDGKGILWYNHKGNGFEDNSLYIGGSGDYKIPTLKDFLNSKAKNGYTRLPNGLIIQWIYKSSSANFSSGGYVNAKFPITFPNAVLSWSATHGYYQGGWDYNFSVGAQCSTSECNFWVAKRVSASNMDFYCIAIGY